MGLAVGQLPEFREPVQIATAGSAPPRPNREPDARNAPSKSAMDVTLPAVVNGRILPGEVDRVRFPRAKASASSWSPAPAPSSPTSPKPCPAGFRPHSA